MDVSPPIVWHGMVRMSFDDLSGLATLWAAKCDFFAIAQHEADEEVDITHCHMMIGSPSLKKDSYQKIMHKIGIDPGKGNHWIMDRTQKTKQPYSRAKLLGYLLKGDPLRLKFSKNISPAEVEAATSEWVEPGLGNSTKREPSQPAKKPKQENLTHYQTCQEILRKAKAEHPEWFKSDITTYFAEDEDEFTLRSDYHKHMWDLMIKELNRRKIRASINELERFYTTIMRNDHETKSLLFQNFWRKIRS